MSLRPALCLLALALAACGDARDAQPIANEPAIDIANAPDPALAEALAAPILTDPDLADDANGDALRPPPRPLSIALPPEDIAPARPDSRKLRAAPKAVAGCPSCAAAANALTLAELAATRNRACSATLTYSARWAARLPADLALPADARVREAAGSDEDGCALRVVRFVSVLPVARLLDSYATSAAAGGLSVAHRSAGEAHALTGARARDGLRFLVVMRPWRGGGSAVDVVVDRDG